MEWMIPAVVATLASSMVLFFVHAYLYSCEREEFLKIWAVGWGVYSARFIFLLIFILWQPAPVFLIFNQLASLWAGWFILKGATRFGGRVLPRWWFLVSIVGSVWIVFATIQHLGFIWLTLPTFIFFGIVNIWTGITFFQIKDVFGPGKYVVGTVFILWGLHKLDYPFMQPVKWLGPWGYLVAALLGLLASIATILLYFEKSRVKLQKKEERLKATFHQAAVGIARVSLAGRWLEVNKKMCAILGYTKAELLELDFQSITHPDDLAADTKVLKQLTSRELRSHQAEKRYIRKDGSIVWATRTVGGVFKADGQIAYLIAVIEDISERRRAVEALRNRERYLNSILATVTDGFLLIDRGGVVLQANSAACTMMGYDIGEMVGSHVSTINADDTPAIVADRVATIKRNGSHLFETRHRRKDGTIFPVEVLASFLEEKDGLVFSFFRDITERKEAVREQERLAMAVEQSSDSIVITNIDGEIQYVNPSFEKVTGYTRAEVLGENPRILQSGEHGDAFYEELWETLTAGKSWSGRIVNRAKSGQRFIEEAVISPVRDVTGVTVNYVAVKRDITHEETLKAQFYQSQKMESVGQLAGGIAHDFNNLLQAIIGYGELATIEAPPDSEQKRNLGEVHKAALRAVSLVKQLLAFSRQQVLELKWINLNVAVADMFKMLRRIISEDIELLFKRGDALGLVRADAGQLGQILTNLCVNARDAIQGGGTITITTERVTLEPSFCQANPWARTGDYVKLSVADTGQGMAPATLERVFEPFFTTKGPGKGTGLGLSTVYGLVQQHDGLINVVSTPSSGTTVSIFFPRIEGEAQHEEQRLPSQIPAGGETLLLAEDDELVREFTRTILTRAGYRVIAAVDGVEAIALFEANRGSIKMAILDVVMPRMGGREVYDHIHAVSPSIPVLFASGYTFEGVHTNFVLDEGMTLLDKPFKREVLLRKVREMLDRR